jgi:chemotaxis protein methyltransferase WspC
MIYADFESLLQQAMGLDAASIGSSAVERAVDARAAACEIDDVRAYWELVSTSASELQELIEAVVVPETWFFRDSESLAMLGRVAYEDWLPNRPEGTLRLLSLPCSSGEEPYSMAMALLDAGFPISRCRIDAIDISAQALRNAQCAVYGKNSFRGADLKFRDRYFTATTRGFRLIDAARQQVSFQQGNLLADEFMPGVEFYDIIFCRNLLIYFDRATQDRAVQVLQRLLKPKGLLFVGPSEGSLLLRHDFVSTKAPLAFEYRRGRHAAPCAVVPAVAAPPVQPTRIAPPFAAHKPSLVSCAKPIEAHHPSRPAEPPASINTALEAALRLADQGRLDEAEKSYEEHLRQYGPSAQIFYLMGLIRAAAGDLSQASQFYRKALYLDQNHYETLLHLGLLLEKQGEAAAAQVLRDRLLRQQQKSGVS